MQQAIPIPEQNHPNICRLGVELAHIPILPPNPVNDGIQPSIQSSQRRGYYTGGHYPNNGDHKPKHTPSYTDLDHESAFPACNAPKSRGRKKKAACENCHNRKVGNYAFNA